MISKFSMCAAIAAATTLGASLTHAVIAPNLVPGSPTATTGGFLWTYDAKAQNASEVTQGDYFTLYDFQGYNPANPNASITAPTDWVATSSLTTPPPPNYGAITALDDPSIYNVTFQYFGTGVAGDLGNFSIFSTFGQVSPTPGIYAGQDHDAAGNPLQFAATTDTPATPEPTTLALLSLTAAPLVLRRRRA